MQAMDTSLVVLVSWTDRDIDPFGAYYYKNMEDCYFCDIRITCDGTETFSFEERHLREAWSEMLRLGFTVETGALFRDPALPARAPTFMVMSAFIDNDTKPSEVASALKAKLPHPGRSHIKVDVTKTDCPGIDSSDESDY